MTYAGLTTEDLKAIASFNRIVRNYLKMQNIKTMGYTGYQNETPKQIFARSAPDIDTLQNDLLWYKEEVIRLEREINHLEVTLHEKELEIERLKQ